MPVELPVRLEAEAQEMVPTAGFAGPSMIDSIPLRLVLLLASPYLAGRTAKDAIKHAHRLYKQDCFTGTVDILGEDAETAEECDRYVQLYKELITEVSQSQIPSDNPLELMTVSLKPSMFSTVAPRRGESAELDRAYERIKSVAEHALAHKVRVTIEAEDHRWTDFHLDTYLSLVNEGYTNLGTVLQSRLFRTRNDIKRFDERMRVRMVIGIYNEFAEIAHTEKSVMKDLLVEFARDLSMRGTYIELATHDSSCIDNFFLKVAIPERLPSSKFETQFLLGVPRKKLQVSLRSGSYFNGLAHHAEGRELAYLEEMEKSGVLVRMYLPYGHDKVAGPYCKRRLKANPNMIGYGIKNLLHIQ